MTTVLFRRTPIFDRRFRAEAYLFEPWDGEEQPSAAATANGAKLVAAALDAGIERLAGALTPVFPADWDALARSPEAWGALASMQSGVLVRGAPGTLQAQDTFAKLAEEGLRVWVYEPPAELVEAAPEGLGAVAVDWRRGEAAKELVRKARRRLSAKVMAFGLDDHELVADAQGFGVDGFEGMFFQKPERVRAKAVEQSQLAVLRALSRAQTAETAVELAEIIRSDVGLSYRLLRYIQSPAFGLRAKVRSVEQALALLGLSNVRKWLALLAVATLGERKPDALVRTALARAHFMEALAKLAGEEETADDFLTGLLSVLDALLDQPMEEAVRHLALEDEVRQALVEEKGMLGARLALAKAVERGDWARAYRLVHNGLGLPVMELARAWHEALGWADEQMEALAA